MHDALERYVADLARDASYSFTGMKVTLGLCPRCCLRGGTLRSSRALKAEVSVIGVEPTGLEHQRRMWRDASRCRRQGGAGAVLDWLSTAMPTGLIASDEKGRIVDGDRIMAILARHWHKTGKLKNDIVVTTVMANLGFLRSMKDAGIEVVTTQVGDRYVLEAMNQRKAILGGEQSGHVICLDRGRTGDGLLTGIRLLEVMAGTGRSLAELSEEAMISFPQRLVNVRVERKDRLASAASVWDAVSEVESELGDDGRVLVRESGTEPLVRVMVEASRADDAERYADHLAEVVQAALGSQDD
jgi:phosphoglucosamine mutase